MLFDLISFSWSNALYLGIHSGESCETAELQGRVVIEASSLSSGTDEWQIVVGFMTNTTPALSFWEGYTALGG